MKARKFAVFKAILHQVLKEQHKLSLDSTESIQAMNLTEKQIRELSRQVETKVREGAELVVEDLLNEFPELKSDDEALLELIYAEIATLDELKKPVEKERLCKRFPELSQRIERLIAVHNSFRPEQDSPGATLDTHTTSLTHPNTFDLSGNQSKPPRKIDDYELLERIGVGGMGVVYKARQAVTNRLVAIKLIKNPAIESSNTQRLLNEARATASLVHENIVQVYHAGTHDDLPYLCLEYVDGGSLADLINIGTFAPRVACEMLLQIARGVEAAHEQGIVHRDLKPANVLLTNSQQPKLVDFGLAKFAFEAVSNDEKLTQTGTMLGSLVYMAPEQFSSNQDQVTQNADIYALGVILYEMLTGGPPFAGESPLETAQMIKGREPVAIRKLNAAVPAELDTICQKCLQKNPRDRFRSVTELADDLQRFLDGRSIKSQPASQLNRAWKWSKRNPYYASLITAIAVLLLVMGLGGFWMGWNQFQLRQVANQRAVRAENAETLAEQRADEANKISKFVIDTFRSPDPHVSGREITVFSRLKDATINVQEEFDDNSPTKASMLLALGKTYSGLGEYQEALPLLRQAFEIRQSIGGYEDLETLEAQSELARALDALDDSESAIAHMRHATHWYRKLLGLKNEQTIRAMIALGFYLDEAGYREEAGENFLLALDNAQSHFGETAPITFEAIEGQASHLRAAGNLQESFELLDGQITKASRQLGDDNLLVIGLMESTGTIHRAVGNIGEAIKYYDKAYKVLKEKLTDNHSRTLTCLNNLAVALADNGEKKKACEILERVLELRIKNYGEDNADTLTCMLNVGAAVTDIGQFDRAEDLLLRAYKGLVVVRGIDHEMTLQAMARYGLVLSRANKSTEAIDVLQECIELSKDNPKVNPEVHFIARYNLATAYRHHGMNEEAIATYTQIIDEIDQWHPNHPLKLACLNGLANALSHTDQMEEAIEVNRRLVEELVARYGANHLNVAINKFNLAMTYRNIEEYEEALELLLTVEQDFDKVDDNPYFYHYIRFQIGRCYLDLERIDDGVDKMNAAYENMIEMIHGFAPQRRSEFSRELGKIASQLEELGKTEEAQLFSERSQLVDQ